MWRNNWISEDTHYLLGVLTLYLGPSGVNLRFIWALVIWTFGWSKINTITNFDVSQILLDQGSFCYIMYVNLFCKFGWRKETLAPYIRTHFKGFNGTLILLWGFIEIFLPFGNRTTPKPSMSNSY